MNYILAALALAGFMIAGHSDQKYIREMQAHEILEQYGTRLQHCLDRHELKTITTSRTLSEGQKTWIYEEDMRTCSEIERGLNPSIEML